MTTYREEGSTLSRLITWFFVALLAIAALKLAVWLLGIGFLVGGFLLFKVAPLLLVGWLLLKVLRRTGEKAPGG